MERYEFFVRKNLIYVDPPMEVIDTIMAFTCNYNRPAEQLHIHLYVSSGSVFNVLYEIHSRLKAGKHLKHNKVIFHIPRFHVDIYDKVVGLFGYDVNTRIFQESFREPHMFLDSITSWKLYQPAFTRHLGELYENYHCITFDYSTDSFKCMNRSIGMRTMKELEKSKGDGLLWIKLKDYLIEPGMDS